MRKNICVKDPVFPPPKVALVVVVGVDNDIVAEHRHVTNLVSYFSDIVDKLKLFGGPWLCERFDELSTEFNASYFAWIKKSSPYL